MAPLTASLALAALLALPGLALAVPESRAGADGRESAPARAASAPLWRAPGLPAEDNWDDLGAVAAEADASDQPAQPKTARPARPASAPRPRSQQPADEPSAVMAVAKSALGWLKEAVPWAFSDEQDAPPREIVVTGDMLLGPAHEVIGPGSDRRMGGGASPPGTGPVAGPGAGMGPPDARRGGLAVTGDPLQEAIAVVREVARHPMTWLLIALVVIGRLVIWLLARPVRRARVSRRHRRRQRQ